MIWRYLLLALFWSSAFAHDAFAEGTIRLRRVAPAPQKKTSDAMKTQREIAAQIKLQEDYYRMTSQLDAGEKRVQQLKADLEFARIADPERIGGIKKSIKLQEVANVRLQREIFTLHRRLTFTLKSRPTPKRYPASVAPPRKKR